MTLMTLSQISHKERFAKLLKNQLTNPLNACMILSYCSGGIRMKMKKTRAAVTISMPQDMAEEYDKLSKRLAKNRSVLFREMFLAYKRQNVKEEFRELQTYGTALGQKRRLFTESDIEKLVFHGR